MKKRLTLALAVVVLAAFTNLGTAQEKEKQEKEASAQKSISKSILCPFPVPINLTAQASQAATPYAPDFPTPVPPLTNFGGTLNDRTLRHTFMWERATECCQCIGGTLTLKYKALLGGQSATSPDAGNDRVVIYSGNQVLLNLPLYTSFGFPEGQTRTKHIWLKCEWLTNHRLSFAVQDDTSVTSATICVDYCCIRN